MAMLATFLSTASVPSREASDTSKFSVKDQIKLILDNRPFFIYLLAKSGGLMAQGSITASLLYFGTYVLMRPDELLLAFSLYITIGQLASIPLWRPDRQSLRQAQHLHGRFRRTCANHPVLSARNRGRAYIHPQCQGRRIGRIHLRYLDDGLRHSARHDGLRPATHGN